MITVRLFVTPTALPFSGWQRLGCGRWTRPAPTGSICTCSRPIPFSSQRWLASHRGLSPCAMVEGPLPPVTLNLSLRSWRSLDAHCIGARRPQAPDGRRVDSGGFDCCGAVVFTLEFHLVPGLSLELFSR